MSRDTLVSVGGVVLGVVVIGASFEKQTQGVHSFLGISGSPIARLLSRVVTDRGDDAFHGGATHDIRFKPETVAGRAVARVVRGRGIGGAAGRHDTGAAAREAYSKDVARWINAARDLDPGNFDALLTYCHYLQEGGFDVEVGEEGGGERIREDAEGNRTVRKNPGETRRQIARAVRLFFSKSTLSDKTSWYSAVAAAQMLHEADPAHFGARRATQLSRLQSVMRMLLRAGDSCTVVWGGEKDVEASRQFAVALLHTVEEAIDKETKNGKNTLFKRVGSP